MPPDIARFVMGSKLAPPVRSAPVTPEFRRDPLSGRSIIISTERARRPQPRTAGNPPADAAPCPFCPGNEAETPPEVLAYRDGNAAPNGAGWNVRVVPNKYPAVINEEPRGVRAEGLYESTSAAGIHEVIIEAPDHVLQMSALSEVQIAAVLRAYRERLVELQKDRRWRSVLIYKNQGGPAGATLEHTHSQLIALPEIPKNVIEEIAEARAHFNAVGRCLYCEIVRQESSERKRWVVESERFIALCPYAARFPYETWILPRAHEPSFERIRDDALIELARCLRQTLVRFDRQLGDPPLNYILHTRPAVEDANGYYDWHFEILPKLTQVAGFEWGSGSFINPVSPEEAARLLRAVTF